MTLLQCGWLGIQQFALFWCTVSIPQFLSKFQWNTTKFPTKQSLKSIGEIIAKVFHD